MTDLQREVSDLKHRVERAETRLSQLEGQFGFIAGQLRDMQMFMHAKFDDIEHQLQDLPTRVAAEVVGVLKAQ